MGSPSTTPPTQRRPAVPDTVSSAATSATWSRRASRSCLGSWSSQQLCLLRGELLLREDALRFQLSQLLQLVDGRARGRGGNWCRRGLLGLLLFFLRGPALALTARDTVADGRRRAGDDGGASHSTK